MLPAQPQWYCHSLSTNEGCTCLTVSQFRLFVGSAGRTASRAFRRYGGEFHANKTEKAITCSNARQPSRARSLRRLGRCHGANGSSFADEDT